MKNTCRDLSLEYDALDAIVSGLDESEWEIITPFYGWTIKDEISHIAYFDEAAKLSATSQELFGKQMEKMLEGFTDFDEMHKKVNAVGGKLPVSDLLSWWRKERTLLIKAYEKLDPKDRLPWYGPTMSARSSATARLMETWAHGQDIVDALKIKRPATERLKHIAHIGVTTFGWSFKNRGMEVPEEKVRVELTGPAGDLWTWGPEDANDIVRGPAQDFCLVVTQRRSLADTKIQIEGDTAEKWMQIAQAFAGPPENSPAQGERVVSK
ncbi:MAG: TIGR03084 family protein [Deltaproteobacteria bacterium]|nr:TIGR03084 family protein [Deltaproteobacteria bacterium]